MKRISDDPVKAGTLFSTESTERQKILYNYVAYFGKIAKQFHLTKVTIKIPRPNGLEMFLAEKESMEKEKNAKLTKEELENLENHTRFETLNSKELGNGQSLLNHFMGEAFTGDKYRDIIEKCKEEALALAFQSATSEKVKEPKDDVSYR